MSLPVKKIYVDSKYKTLDSVSNSNFKFQLPHNIYMPINTVFYLEDVCIPHSWTTVETGINDTIYLEYQATIDGVIPLTGPMTHYIQAITIPPNNYTGQSLATQVQTLLNVFDSFVVAYNTNTGTLSITHTVSGYKVFRFPTDFELQLTSLPVYQWPGSSLLPMIPVVLNQSNPGSWNDMIGNTGESMGFFQANVTYTSGMLDLLTIRNIFLSSPNLGSFSTLGARGESNIIKKIPVSSDYGYLIIDSFTSPHDFLDCSKLTLGTIEFSLKDVKGNLVPLHGGHVSFSIVFSSINIDR